MAVVYLSGNSYKFILKTGGTPGSCADGSILWTQDNITGIFPLAGNNNFSGTNTHSGTETFSGTLRVANLNNVVFADQQAGADVCAKITAAEALLPSTGGVVDARGFQGTQTACSSGFNVGANGKGVTLLLGYVTIPVSGQVFVWGGSGIVCPASNNAGVFPCFIEASVTFPINTTLVQLDNTQVTFSITLQNLGIGCQGITGCRGVDTGSLQDTGLLTGLWITDYLATDGGCVRTGAAAPTENFTLDRIGCVAAVTAAGVTSIALNGVGDHFYLNNISVASKSAAPQAAGITCNGCNLVAGSLHVENATDGLLFTGTGGTSSVQEIDGLVNITNVVRIASTYTGNATVMAIKKNSATNSVKNDNATLGVGGTCTDENLGYYIVTSTPQVLTSCTSLPNFYTSNANTGFVFTVGNGMRIVDYTPAHARILGFGPNVVAGDTFGWYDYSAPRASFYCSFLSPFACTFPGDIKFGNLLLSATAPSTGTCGTSPSIPSNNGTGAFTVNVGSGGTANTCQINLPTAATGWICSAFDITNPTTGGGFFVKQTAGTTSQATLSGYNTAGALTAWTASDILRVSCHAY
jgi:hypothetical protein